MTPDISGMRRGYRIGRILPSMMFLTAYIWLSTFDSGQACRYSLGWWEKDRAKVGMVLTTANAALSAKIIKRAGGLNVRVDMHAINRDGCDYQWCGCAPGRCRVGGPQKTVLVSSEWCQRPARSRGYRPRQTASLPGFQCQGQN